MMLPAQVLAQVPSTLQTLRGATLGFRLMRCRSTPLPMSVQWLGVVGRSSLRRPRRPPPRHHRKVPAAGGLPLALDRIPVRTPRTSCLSQRSTRADHAYHDHASSCEGAETLRSAAIAMMRAPITATLTELCQAAACLAWLPCRHRSIPLHLGLPNWCVEIPETLRTETENTVHQP